VGYPAALALVGGVATLALFAFGRDAPADVVMLFLLGVVVASLTLGRGPSLFAALLSVAAFDFFFVPPYLTFSVTDVRHLVTFAVMLLVALVMSHLTRRVRAPAAAARARERRTAALYDMSRDLGGAVERSELVARAARHIARVFEGDVTVFVPEGAELGVAFRSGRTPVSSEELDVARWVRTNRREAGLSTRTPADARGLYVPLSTTHGLLGVLAVAPRDPARFSDPEERRFLEAFAAQMGVAVERTQLAEESDRARLESERERLRSALLSSVSHDLRTPLGVIEGSASTLLDESAALDAGTRRDLLLTVREESERLGRRVRDLLDMTRLESGSVQLDLEWQSLEEVVGAALERVERGRVERRVTVELPESLPLLRCDGALVEQVLVNLLENALKYSPPGSPIEVSARDGGGEVVVSVADRGPGVPAGEEERIFEKFQRASTQRGGVGLGLAICRAILAAHGGWIQARHRQGGGAVFHLGLPRQDPPAGAPAEPPA
jgi:two-component system sensor histidine kinase KdpD